MYSKDCEKYEYAYMNGEDGEEGGEIVYATPKSSQSGLFLSLL